MAADRSYRYRVVDVFTEVPLEGNALAVFPEASGLDDTTMQRVARELNLSETVFVLPPEREDCAAALRIFTPSRELVFAGHPTVGTAFVLLAEGIVPARSERFLLQEKIGPVPVRVEHGARPLIWLTTPAIEFKQEFDPHLCAQALGLQTGDVINVPPQLVSAGNPSLFVPLKKKDAVDQASLEMEGFRQLRGSHPESFCVFPFAPTATGAYSRMFAPEYGIIEDPATGSATGPLAAYMLRRNLLSGALRSRFISEQGAKMGRRSLLHVLVHGANEAEEIEVGGYVTPLVNGAVMQL